nr:hypothetical protein [Tanacetum cinerariifolium]
MQFLMGLNDVYQNIRSNILARDPLLDVKEAFNVVSREESHRGLHSGSGSSSGNKVQHAAFVVKSNNYKGGNSNIKVFNGNSEAPKGASCSFRFANFDTPFTKDQMKILSLINEKPTGNASAKMAGWIIDSRYNQHFTVSTKNMFNVTNISGLNLTVRHPNGTLAKISAILNLRLTSNVVLFDVLVIPEYNVSLMSVQLIKDSKML